MPRKKKKERRQRHRGSVPTAFELSAAEIWPNDGTIALPPCHWCGSPYDNNHNHTVGCIQAFLESTRGTIDIAPPCQFDLYEVE